MSVLEDQPQQHISIIYIYLYVSYQSLSISRFPQALEIMENLENH